MNSGLILLFSLAAMLCMSMGKLLGQGVPVVYFQDQGSTTKYDAVFHHFFIIIMPYFS